MSNETIGMCPRCGDSLTNGHVCPKWMPLAGYLHFVEIPVKRLFKDVELPEYQTVGSSGADIKAYIPEFKDTEKDSYQSSFILVGPGETRKIRSGLCVEIPSSLEIQIRPRSSMSMRGLVAFGTIDSDYRGEIHIIVSNISNEHVKVHHGDRIAQVVLAPVKKIKWKDSPFLNDTERGSGGFGHTGL